MTTPSQFDDNGSVIEFDTEAVYTLDIVASLCGISSQTILHYHEQGLIQPIVEDDLGSWRFDDEAVHRLRRIADLRSIYGMDVSALKFALDLLDELERLRTELRLRI
jgi:chaperone modulatory protein CbpM